jgi:hypothetical protein
MPKTDIGDVRYLVPLGPKYLFYDKTDENS